MIDVVFPDGNEKEFLEMAEKLGYSDLCFAYKDKIREQKFTASFKDRKANLLLTKPGNSLSKNFDVVVGIEEQRITNTFFKEAAEKKVLLGLNFSAMLRAGNKPKILNSAKYVIRMARKSRAQLLIASFADEPFLMRAPNDLQSFYCCLGMNPGEAKKAINAAQERIELNKKRKKPGYVEGVELIE